MNVRKIGTEAQLVSRWSGGTTTQLAICPENAVYADRDFLWRLSSAVVELPESDFTPLPDYDRILMILKGKLALSHDGQEEYSLGELEQTAFDGAARTFSRGQVTDFNLMMRKGCCTGRVEAQVLNGAEWNGLLSREYESHLLYCVDGSADVDIGNGAHHIGRGEALMVDGCEGERCVIRGTATLVLAEMKKL